MTLSTIKVPSTLRDQLSEQAAAEGRTLGEHLSALAEREERRRRMVAVRDAMARTPEASMDEYRGEVAAFDAAYSRDGLPSQ